MHLSKGLVEKKVLHISSIDRKFVNNLKITKEYLRKNKDLMCTNGDKSNISILMRRSEYIRDMEELLGNVENFEVLDQDPLNKLKSSSFRMVDNWRKKGLLGKDTRWRDIDTTNTVLARCYGLRKIQKEKYSLRLVVWTINTPTRFLEKNFNMILKNSLSKSNYTFKNSWEFQKIIVTKTIPDGHVMISLDVLAMFPNILLDLVKKAVSNRWIKVKSHTKLDKKEFLKGLDFIMNSTKFKFSGKFYKQKFGTPIGSVIAPILTEIVMEDLEKTVFERLEFVVPFYFRYVDDTLLCIPLDKLQRVIDTFNDYRPRVQFTHEMERNNRISFFDLGIIKLDNGKIVSNWYRKSTYSGRMLNFISYHPFQNKIAIIKNLVDRAVCFSHESFHSENQEVVRKILFFNHYSQDLIEKHKN